MPENVGETKTAQTSTIRRSGSRRKKKKNQLPIGFAVFVLIVALGFALGLLWRCTGPLDAASDLFYRSPAFVLLPL